MPRETAAQRATKYIADVVSGQIITNKLVRLQCQRHLRDLETGAERGLIFSPNRGAHVINFIERYVPRVDKGHRGEPYRLDPWMCALLWIMYGWRRTNGLRRWRVAYCEVARSNMKSTLASALSLYELLIPSANVYSAATDKGTSKVVFDTADDMVTLSPQLSQRITSYRNNLHSRKLGSKFEPCSAEGKTLFQNSRPSFVTTDELHLHATDEVWNAFFTALSKQDGLLFAITNSGYDRTSVCWRQREYSLKVLEGIIEDDTWLAFVFGLDPDEKDNWEDESLWIKANPSLGNSIKIEDLRAHATRAKADPSELNTFLRFRLCIWTESLVQWMPTDAWAACSDLVDPEALKGRQCFGGLDLSTTTDISAFVLLFPPYGDDKKWRVLPHFFLPGDNVTKRVKRDRVPYDVWQRQGLFILTPGNVIDTGFIRAKINELSGLYKIVEIAFDKAFSADITPQLQDDGMTMTAFHPGEFSQTPPMKKLMELVLKQEIAHGGNPVLRWMASNLVARVGPTGLMKPDKERSAEKIDGLSALLDALGRAMIVPLAKPKATFKPFFV